MLKKCPFCGGKAKGHASRNKNGGWWFSVKCGYCRASGPSYYTRNDYSGDEEDMWEDGEYISAENAWNRRADPREEAEC